jgi:hypothetical protein
LVPLPVCCRPTTELDPPQLVDLNRRAPGVFDGTDKRPGSEIEAINGPGIGVVGDQQGFYYSY